MADYTVERNTEHFTELKPTIGGRTKSNSRVRSDRRLRAMAAID
jgi:hypothetical protein